MPQVIFRRPGIKEQKKLLKKKCLYSGNRVYIKLPFQLPVWDYNLNKTKNHSSTPQELLKSVSLSLKVVYWVLQSSQTRSLHSNLYGIFHPNSWALYVCRIAMWHTVQSDGVLEVLKAGHSLKAHTGHVTNLKYEKERNSVAKSMKPEPHAFARPFYCS